VAKKHSQTPTKVTASSAGVSVNGLFVIDDETLTDPRVKDNVFVPVIDGELKGHGLVPRDYRIHPPEMFAPPSELHLIPRPEWSDRLKEQERAGARLSDIRGDWPALDQNGQGYCWAYSTTSAVMLLRSVNNQPYVRMSAHAIGCKVKNFRNEGGWCGLSAKFHRENGCPSVAMWPEKSMSRSNDRADVWSNAALHKVTEDWVDLTRDVYDQNLTFNQVATCLLSGIPCAVDFNWWSHSVCGADLVEVEPGSFGLRILNSWSNSWGERGAGILRGSKAIPDEAVAMRVTGISPT
jgi:hypothetical protein